MIDALITNKTRLKLLLKFFLNPGSVSYLRGLEDEFNESTNAIRIELNRFESAGLLVSFSEKNKKLFKANTHHPLFRELQSILKKSLGVDQVLETVVQQIGGLHKVYLIGELARGNDSKLIELMMVGDDIDHGSLDQLVKKTEQVIQRKIQCLLLKVADEKDHKKRHPEAWLIYQS